MELLKNKEINEQQNTDINKKTKPNKYDSERSALPVPVYREPGPAQGGIELQPGRIMNFLVQCTYRRF